MNVSIISKQDCCGCELCEAICTKKAIVFKSDAEGFNYPHVDVEKCIECEMCLKYCPFNVDNCKKTNHNIDTFALSIDCDASLKESSSGGAAYAIMDYAIRNSMIVIGVAYDDDFKGCHYDISDSFQEIAKFRGTKYIQAKKNNIYRKVKELLKSDSSVIFIGLPCEVAACQLYLGDLYEKIIYVELICHGVTSPKVSEQYVERAVLRYGKIDWMTIRDKRYGWTPGCLKIVFENGKIIHKLFDSTEYGYAFRNLSRPSCYECKYKGDYRVADISIGDFWGCSPSDEFWNPNGVSVVFVHSDRGRELIKSIEGVNITRVEYSLGIKNNSAVNASRQYGKRENYSNSLCKHDIFFARKENESIKEKSIRLLRNLKYNGSKKL